MTNNEEDIEDEPGEGDAVDYTEYFEENRRMVEAENKRAKKGQSK